MRSLGNRRVLMHAVYNLDCSASWTVQLSACCVYWMWVRHTPTVKEGGSSGLTGLAGYMTGAAE